MVNDAAERARALLGARFRAQGRDPALGLDCVGLVLAAHGLPADVARRDYRLRGDHRREIMSVIEDRFRRVPISQRKAGDVLLLEVARDQLHLAIASIAGFVHADARLGRVIETPDDPAWPILAVYRRRARGPRR